MLRKKIRLFILLIFISFLIVSLQQSKQNIAAAASVEHTTKIILNTHEIEGYSDKISYYNGETVYLKVHSPHSVFSIDVLRFGKNQQVKLRTVKVSGQKQNYPEDAYMRGAQWQTSYSFTIPLSWASGMYAAKLYDDSGNSFYVTFIVKGQKDDLQKDIVVVSSTNTWTAYNEWGGASLYAYRLNDNSGKKFSEIVNFHRPNPEANPLGNIGHLANAERHILSWLETQGYSYKVIADRDLQDYPDILHDFKIAILTSHSEYWTSSMYDTLTSYMDQGGTLFYLSGNGIYWKTVLKGNLMEVRKNLDTHLLDNTPGGQWARHMNRPETSLLGVRYQDTGFSVPAPYRVENPDHWIFQGTKLKKGDLIGEKGLNTIHGSTGGASGWETDQIDKFTPKNSVLLAKGTNTQGVGADMIYYDHKGGGGVFSSGSITFGGSLAVDPDLSKMLINLIEHFSPNNDGQNLKSTISTILKLWIKQWDYS